MRTWRTSVILLAAALLMASAPAASAEGVGVSCDISGTWYGGSNPQTPYLWTITPMGGGRYSSVAANAYPTSQLPGYNSTTNWSIELRKVNARDYKAYGMSYFVYQWPDINTPQLPEVDIVRSRVRLVDCNTMVSTIDVYAAYFSFDSTSMTPFVTPPDIDFLAVYLGWAALVETYHRMPTTCPTCPFPAATGGAAPAAAQKSSNPGSKPSTR
jgi:hypothetical protein